MCRTAIRSLLLFILILPVAVADERTTLETTPAGNVYGSGADLQLGAPVERDLLAAGGRISVQRGVGADAALAGGSVEVRAPIREDLRVAGGTVNIENAIGGELVAAGGTIRLEESAAVAGMAWLAGGNVTVAGKIGQGARIYANRATISGMIEGDARIAARDIELQPGARITGNLVYASSNPLDPDAANQVGGTITREPLRDAASAAPPGVASTAQAAAWAIPFVALSMLATGAVLALLFPNAVAGTQRTIGRYPVRSLLIGLALLFTVPPVAVLLMMTVVGVPIGLTLLALYLPMILVGFLGTAFFIGRRAADAMKQPERLRFGRQLLFLAAALVILGLSAAIPFVGALLLLLAVMLGIGGWATCIYLEHYDSRHAPG